MASAGESMADIRRMLECPICMEKLNKPRMLPCLHSFCEKCLSTHMLEKGQTGSFKCPLCNSVLEVPKEGVSGFSHNFLVGQLCEVVPDEEGIHCDKDIQHCDICKLQDSKVPAKSICLQCKDHLCHYCTQSHCKTRQTLDHEVVGLDEEASGDCEKDILHSEKAYCQHHPDEGLDMYCETCRTSVCQSCKTHNQHKVSDLKEAAKHADDVVRELLEPRRAATEHYELLHAKKREVLKNIDQQEKERSDEIMNIFSEFTQKIIHQVEVEQEAALDNLKSEVAIFRKQAESACSEADLTKTTYRSVLEFAEKILNSTQDDEKLRQFADVKSRLEGLDLGITENTFSKPVFVLQPSKIEIPRFTVNTVTKVEKGQIASPLKQLRPRPSAPPPPSYECAPPPPSYESTEYKYQNYTAVIMAKQIARNPIVKKPAVLVRQFKSRFQTETRSNCFGLSVNKYWIIITDKDNKTVKVFEKEYFNLKFMLKQDRHKLQYPHDVTSNSGGDIFVCDSGIRGVVRYDNRGRVVKVSPRLYSVEGYITCHSDQLFVADYLGGRVLVTDFDCNIKQVINASTLGIGWFVPGSICVDNDSHIVVCDSVSYAVYVIDYTRLIILHTYKYTNGAMPQGICVDQFGHILVNTYSLNKSVIVLYKNVSEHKVATDHDITYSTATGLCIFGPGQVCIMEQDTGDFKIFQYLDM